MTTPTRLDYPHMQQVDLNHGLPIDDWGDLDFSFTSCTTDRTYVSSSSARTSLARSSLTLSFNDRLSSATATTTTTTNVNVPSALHHRKWDPHWTAIKAATNLSSDKSLHLRHLKLLRHLGSGNLGRVFLCRLRDYNPENSLFALKVVDHAAISPKKQAHVETEAQILALLDHPFLPTLYSRIDVSHYTCLLIDFCPNGDLQKLLLQQPTRRLLVRNVRFYAAEVLAALEYLHALGIVYRDLKPENVLLREDGHIMLSDFDLCFKSDVVPTLERRRVLKPRPSRKTRSSAGCFGSYSSQPKEREEMEAEFVAEPTSAFSMSCVGTHEYLAPELVGGHGHGNGVDWWAFGIFIFELLYGTTPFKGESSERTLRNIAFADGVSFHVAEGEEEGMKEARDLIQGLLVRDPHKRLGCTKGATEIKRHPFFRGINWALLKSYRPPDVIGVKKKPIKITVAPVGLSLSAHKRRRSWWWKGLGQLVKSRSNKKKSQSNSNYYHYVSEKVVRRS